MCTAVDGGSIHRAPKRLIAASDHVPSTPMTSQRRNDRTTFWRRNLVCVSDPSATIQTISFGFFPEDRTASGPSMVGGFLEASIICKAVQCSQIAKINEHQFTEQFPSRHGQILHQLTEANTKPMTHDESIEKPIADSVEHYDAPGVRHSRLREGRVLVTWGAGKPAVCSCECTSLECW